MNANDEAQCVGNNRFVMESFGFIRHSAVVTSAIARRVVC